MTPSDFDSFILQNFGGVLRDNPWEKEPEFTVFRHADNRKWFALRFHATREQLAKLQPDDQILQSYPLAARVEIANLKVDPEMILDLVSLPGFMPAFHMSRRHWITILLDKRVDPAKIKPLIDLSYQLTAARHCPAK